MLPPLSLSLQFEAFERLAQHRALLSRARVRRWVAFALQRSATIGVRVVGRPSAQALNLQYRGKDYATNVLTFAYAQGVCRTWGVDSENRPQQDQFAPTLQPHSGPMGQKGGEKWAAAVDLQPTMPKSDRLLEPEVHADLVLCGPVVEQEAAQLGRSLEAHYAHLLVHGTLHAQGWDHETNEREALAMETLEGLLLCALGYANPYA